MNDSNGSLGSRNFEKNVTLSSFNQPNSNNMQNTKLITNNSQINHPQLQPPPVYIRFGANITTSAVNQGI
jgi:hypothetical protein